MKIGRNDPCPCGSGKKFKKCCIDKPEYQTSSATATLPRNKTALKKNLVQENPWLTSLADPVDPRDLEMLFRAFQGAEQGRLEEIDEQVNQLNKLNKLSTDDILEKLRIAGAHVDESTFAISAKQLHSSRLLSETWTGEPWESLAFSAAADVLWERWCPDVFRWENFNYLMMRGYEIWERKLESSLETCIVWQKAWEKLRDFAQSEGIDNVDEIMETCPPHLMEDPLDWFENLEVELQNACLDDLEWAHDLLAYAREFQQVFSKSDQSILDNMRLAEGDALFLLNRPQEGDAHFEAMIAEDPTTAWPYVRWGDHYVPGPMKIHSDFTDLRKAHEIFNRGLKAATQDRDAIEDRLR